MRNYSEEVEVRVGDPLGQPFEPDALHEPTQFLWRGRLWKVRAVLARWVETPPWWDGVAAAAGGSSDAPSTSAQSTDQCDAQSAGQAPADGGGVGELVADRECWRVEAGSQSTSGVFDLSLDHRDGRWELVGCAD